jgi:hypothetical protein
MHGDGHNWQVKFVSGYDVELHCNLQLCVLKSIYPVVQDRHKLLLKHSKQGGKQATHVLLLTYLK